MAISTFAAILDANVFFGARLRSLFMEIAASGLFRARWSDDIHREWTEAVVLKRPDLDRLKLDQVRRQMDAAVPDCLVKGYEVLIPALTLPDPDDRHVLAAAIVGRASCIVTFNEADFPESALQPFGIHTRHPDRFLLELEGLENGSFIEAARADRLHYRNPPLSPADYVDGLRRCGLTGSADYLARLQIPFES